jgi:asparagine N-glycosylation enzyme membrane subunit Stt3
LSGAIDLKNDETLREIKAFLSGWAGIRSLDQFKIHIKKWSVWFAQIVILLILLMTFTSRVATWSPIHFELDPYYYIYGGRQLIEFGNMPLDDDTAWYPEIDPVDHRSFSPFLGFIFAHMYNYYTAGGEFENYLYSTVTSFYPPIAAMILVFMIYVLIKEEYGHWYGVIAGFLTFTMPTLLTKMVAGTQEAQPLALMILMFVFACYALTIKRKRWEYLALTGLGIFIAGVGATSLPLITMVIAVYFLAQGILNFISNKETKDLIIFNAVIVVIIIFTELIYRIYSGTFSITFIIGSKILLPLIAVLVVAGLEIIKKINISLPIGFTQLVKKIDPVTLHRTGIVFCLVVVGLLFLLSPFSGPIKAPIRSYIGAATFTNPLQRTIQEQQLTTELISMWLGPLGSNLGIVDAITIIPSLFLKILYSFLNIVLAQVLDLPNLAEQTEVIGNLPPSLALTFIFLTIISVVSELYFNHSEKEKNISLSLFMLVYLLPMTYIGFNKVKFMVYAALGVVMASIIPFVGMAKGLARAVDYMEPDKVEKFIGKTMIHSIMFAIILAIALATFISLDIDNPRLSYSMLMSSTMPKYSDNPIILKEKFEELCEYDAGFCRYANPKTTMTINEQYDIVACMYSVIPNEDIIKSIENPEYGNSLFKKWLNAAGLRCSRVDAEWIDAYEWMEDNTSPKDRITSWWDYGHWTNYFGNRKTVLRNEHTSHNMIHMTAYAYLHGNEKDLWDYMEYFDSDYAVFDFGLVGSPTNMGGKYHALNYLGCAHSDETDVIRRPSESYCEQNNLWEEIYIPPSNVQYCEYAPGQRGIIGYGYVVSSVVQENFTAATGREGLNSLKPKFCVGETEISLNGQITEIPAAYLLNEKNSDGTLKLLRGYVYRQDDIIQEGVVVLNRYWLVFDEEPVWVVNNTLTSGWEDRTSSFYDSNIYKALFLNEIQGFQLVYTNSGLVIFKRNSEPPAGTVTIPAPILN